MTTKLKPGDEATDEVRELFEKHRKYLSAGKSNYKRAGATLEKLLTLCEPGFAVTLEAATKKGKPESHTLVDQFADKNEVWAGSSAKRFKIESKVVKAQDLAASELSEQPEPPAGSAAGE